MDILLNILPWLKFYGLALAGVWVLMILFWVGVWLISGRRG